MTFKPDVPLDENRVETSSNRGLVIGGSSIGALILAGILWYLGVDPSQLQDVLGTGGHIDEPVGVETITLQDDQ